MANRLPTHYPSYSTAPAPVPASAPRPAVLPRSYPYPPPVGGFAPRTVVPPLTGRQVHFAPSATINQPLPGPSASMTRMPAVPAIVFGGPRLPGMGEDQYSVFQLDSPHPIEFRRKVYRNADVLLQVLKFEDAPSNEPIINAVMRSEYPRNEAEKWRAYWRPDWYIKEGALMRDVLQHKLCQHPVLTQTLIATGGYDLVDGEDRTHQNLLGRALMSIRAEFAPRR